MKSFTQYLTESKDRFIKANYNLTKDQKDEMIKFFKANRQAERKVDWQNSKNMKYDDFMDIKMQFKSGRKTMKKVKCQDNISGLTKNEDYVHLKLRSKKYCAYIPLNYEAAQEFNKGKIGVCQGQWCIGHSMDKRYWTDHVVDNAEVPIYIVGQESTWVVMIQHDNRGFDIWDIDNIEPQFHDSIPDFNVKKELFGSKMKSLYDDIRNNYYASDEPDSPQAYHNDVVQEFARNRNLLKFDTEDVDTYSIDWFLENLSYQSFSGCHITVEDDGFHVSGGTIHSGNFIDEECLISIVDCKIIGGYFEMNNYSGSDILGGEVEDGEFQDTKLYDINFISGGKFEDCNVSSLGINGGDFVDCDVRRRGLLKGGNYTGCTMESRVKGFIAAKECKFLKALIEKGNYYDCYFERCEIKGGEFDDKCEFDSYSNI